MKKEPLVSRMHGKKWKKRTDAVLTDLVLIALSILFVAPLVWMISLAFKTPEQSAVYPPHLIPNPFSLRSFEEALSGGMFLTYLKNTVFILLSVILIVRIFTLKLIKKMIYAKKVLLKKTEKNLFLV